MVTGLKDQLNDGFEQVKTIGTTRWQKVWGILQDTFPKLWAEVKSGAQEVGEIGKEVAGNAKTTLQVEGQIRTESLRQRAIEQFQQWWIDLKATVADRLPGVKATVQSKFNDLDGTLSDRYGDYYQTLKDRVDSVVTNYKARQATVKPNSMGTTIEVPYQIVDEQAAKLGVTIAETEAAVKQQVKQQMKDVVAAAVGR
jgi:multidrug efflux pump subunit AcrB